MNDQTPAKTYLTGLDAKWHTEAAVEAILGFKEWDSKNEPFETHQFCEIGGDTYDWSLEISLYHTDYKTFTMTEDQREKILDLGCNRFWVNFLNDDEKKIAEMYMGDMKNLKVHIP